MDAGSHMIPTGKFDYALANEYMVISDHIRLLTQMRRDITLAETMAFTLLASRLDKSKQHEILAED
jgi:hypothetical protein